MPHRMFYPLVLPLLVSSLGALACDLTAMTASKPTVVILAPPSDSIFREGEDTAKPTMPVTTRLSTDQQTKLPLPTRPRSTAQPTKPSPSPEPAQPRKVNCEEMATLFPWGKPPRELTTSPVSGLGTVGRWIDLGLAGAGPVAQFSQALAYSRMANQPVLYAALGRNLYRLDETGQRWEYVPLPTIVKSIAAGPTKPETLYAGGMDRVYKSPDGGKTWSESRLGQDSASIADRRIGCWSVIALAVSRKNSNTVYAGTFNGLFKSPDGGKNWVLLTEGIGTVGFIVWSVAVNPLDDRIVFAGVEDQSRAKPGTPASQSHVPHLFRSSDAGETWTELRTPWHALDIQFDPQDSRVVYLATEGSGILKTTDGGTHWERLDQVGDGIRNGSVSALVIDPTNPQTLFAGTVWDHPGGIFRSDDGGRIWTEMNEGLKGRWVDALAISPDGRVLYATVSQMRETPSAGWESLSNGVFRRTLR